MFALIIFTAFGSLAIGTVAGFIIAALAQAAASEGSDLFPTTDGEPPRLPEREPANVVRGPW